MLYGTAGMVITLLGGSMTVTLPADRKIAALETAVAQTWQEREAWQQTQQEYHTDRRIEDIDFRMRYISNEINRLNMIPQYLDRALTAEESWQIEQLKNEWGLLQNRRQQLLAQ